MKVVTIVQARVGSSRLPGKALKAMCGRPMVYHAITRASAMGFDTWLATSDQDRDTLLAETVAGFGFPVYRGDERDVMHRMLITAILAGAEVIVRVTGDCPCFIPEVGQQVVDLYMGSPDGIASNDTSTSGWPDGLDCEVFSTALLAEADREIPRPTDMITASDTDRMWHDREHVTPWLRRKGPHAILKAPEPFDRIKLSVDSSEDFERVRGLLGRVPANDYSLAAIRSAIEHEEVT